MTSLASSMMARIPDPTNQSLVDLHFPKNERYPPENRPKPNKDSRIADHFYDHFFLRRWL